MFWLHAHLLIIGAYLSFCKIFKKSGCDKNHFYASEKIDTPYQILKTVLTGISCNKAVFLKSRFDWQVTAIGELIMEDFTERRKESRLRYHWPIWFAEDFTDVLSQGQMVDITSASAAFTCYSDQCPPTGRHITTRFSVPRYAEDDSFDLENFVRPGHIYRVDDINPFLHKVVIQFAEPLPFKPGEQQNSLSETEQINEETAV